MRWVETIQAFAARGVTHVVECGPGRVLTGMSKRIDRNLKGYALDAGADIETVARGARRLTTRHTGELMADTALGRTGRAGHRRDARHRRGDRAGARAGRRHGRRHRDHRRGRGEDRGALARGAATRAPAFAST